MTHPTLAKLLILLAMLPCGSQAFAGQLVLASLKNGDYGTGPAGPGTAVAPVTGVVNTADGVLFVATEVGGRSNGLVNWQIGNNLQWRRTGTITFLFKAIRGQFASGSILGDNFGFGTFHNGQGTFGVGAGPVANGAGPEDDRVQITWNTWHNNVWYSHATTQLEYDRWYSIGFAWGGPSEFEIWVDQELMSAVNLAAAGFPWGSDYLQSGFNMGLGDNHERGVDGYNSAPGVMFADVRMWNEYRALGDTVAPNGAPTATDDTYTMSEDATLTVSAPGVLGNDSDPDGDAMTASLAAAPLNGVVTLDPDGSFTYQPHPGFHGTDSFGYEASDGTAVHEATVTIDVASVNDAPSANPDAATTAEDTAITVDVVANDVDPDGDPLTVNTAMTAIGTVSLVPGGLLFTPPADFFGAVTITYTVGDGQGGSAEGVLSITVTPVNDPPAAPGVITVESAGGVPVVVTLTATDVDGDVLTFEPGAATGGIVTGTSPTFTFTPVPGFSGDGGFSYTIRDEAGLSALGTVIVRVTAAHVNRAPIALDDDASITTGGTVLVAVLANDSDADGDPLSIVSVTAPAMGTATVDGQAVRYQADVLGGLAQAIAALPGLNHGQTTSLLARLSNAVRALDRGQADVAARGLLQLADSLERFSNHAAAQAVVARLRALAGASLTDSFSYTIADGQGGSATALVSITLRLQ